MNKFNGLNEVHNKMIANTISGSLLALSLVVGLMTALPSSAQAQNVQNVAASTKQMVDLNPYLRNMGRILSSSWAGDKPDVSRSAKVEFDLHSNGSVSNVKVSGTSGSKVVDDTAINTVKKAALPPLPVGAADDVDVNFTFHLNVY